MVRDLGECRQSAALDAARPIRSAELECDYIEGSCRNRKAKKAAGGGGFPAHAKRLAICGRRAHVADIIGFWLGAGG